MGLTVILWLVSDQLALSLAKLYASVLVEVIDETLRKLSYFIIYLSLEMGLRSANGCMVGRGALSYEEQKM